VVKRADITPANRHMNFVTKHRQPLDVFRRGAETNAAQLPTPFSPKLNLNTKSPLTGLYLFSITSGQIGPNVRNAGYLSIRIRGASETPVYLIISEE
jgi:hypothetical protein